MTQTIITSMLWLGLYRPGGSYSAARQTTAASSDVFAEVFKESTAALGVATGAKGRRLEVLELLEADLGAVDRGDNDACVSYLKYLLVNGGIIVPKFGDEQADRRALKVFERVFPDREVA
jgi:agmatine deiminase